VRFTEVRASKEAETHGSNYITHAKVSPVVGSNRAVVRRVDTEVSRQCHSQLWSTDPRQSNSNHPACLKSANGSDTLRDELTVPK